MDCPAENTWLRYVGGALEPVSVGPLEEHLDSCPSCRFMFVNLARGSAAVAGDATDPTIPAKLIPHDLMQPSELVRGALVDRYVILSTLGRGGMGVVYKAFDPGLDRPVALKLVAVNGVGSDADESRARLLREAKTLAQLSHPNVVAVHDVGSHERDVFVAMEFIAGSTLRRWLKDSPRTPREILAVFRAAGAGLAAAHKLGIVHRDFKPENVMVGDDGRVRVLDFGLARPGERNTARPSLSTIASTGASTMDLTRAGAIMGTPAYMAPEQDLGNEVDGRSDQFSFCAAMYEALFGHRAFAGTSYAEIAAHRLEGDIRPAPSVRGVSARVRRALLRGLRVAPAERHPSMQALLVELRGGTRRTTKLALAALALTTLGAGGWATWVAMHAAPSTEELCEASAREVERVWSPQRKQDLLASFATMKEPDIGERVVAGVDAYAGEWSTRRAALCKLMVEGDKERVRDELASSRMTCLKSHLSTLDATVSVLIHAPTPNIMKRSELMVGELKPLSECDIKDTTLIVTEETRQRWKPMIKELVAGQTALAEGRYEEAERHATTVVTWSTEHDEPEPLAAGLLQLGQIQSRVGLDTRQAKATLLRAVRAATAVREEGMAVEAWLEIIALAFNDRTMLDGLDSAITGAEIAALRLAPDSAHHTQLAYKIGTVHVLRGEMDDAVQKLERALADFKRNATKHRYDIAGVINSLGVAQLYRGEFAKARTSLEHARDEWKTLGILHPNLGSSMMWLGEWSALQHDFTTAQAQYAASIAVFEELGKLGKSSIGKSRFLLGWMHARSGDCAKARPLIAKARDEIAEVSGAETALSALTLLGEGYCELAAGRAHKAVGLLETAVSRAAVTPATLTQVAMTSFTLARALVAAKHDKRRAIALAETARDGFAKYPGAAADRADVEAWLAAQR